MEKAVPKTKSSRKAVKEKGDKAVWDSFAAEVFLDVCIEEVLKRNRNEGHLSKKGYENLIKSFNERTKIKYKQKQFKNR